MISYGTSAVVTSSGNHPSRDPVEGLNDVARQLTLQTPRLAVTSWLVGDVDDLFDVHSDAETMRFVRRGRPETREETAILIDQYMAEHSAAGFTKWRVADLDGHLVDRAGFGFHEDGRERDSRP